MGVLLTAVLAITISISDAELAAQGGDSIALRDGSGYIAEPAVYHEMHCIVSLTALSNYSVQSAEVYPRNASDII